MLITDPHTTECVDKTYTETMCTALTHDDLALQASVTDLDAASSANGDAPTPGYAFRSTEVTYATLAPGADTGLTWKVTRDGRTVDPGGALEQTNRYLTSSSNSPGYLDFTESVHDPATPGGDTVFELADHGKTIWTVRLDDATVLTG